jgi:hypothetical protein
LMSGMPVVVCVSACIIPPQPHANGACALSYSLKGPKAGKIQPSGIAFLRLEKHVWFIQREHFAHANRHPLRLKMLMFSSGELHTP